MTLEKIINYELINEIDEEKVNKIAESIKNNGYIGCPILVTEMGLITGSHRLAALIKLYRECDEFDSDIECAEDVTELVNDAFARFEEENGYTAEMEFDNLGWIFEGTWVEKYKSEIEEW